MGSHCLHIVTLYSKETCSCPSTAQCYHILAGAQCYHILAAKMAIGKQEEPKRGRFNLTQQLRKNSRPRNSKTSGRKYLRIGDCDVIPAPDAAVKKLRSLCGELLKVSFHHLDT